MPTLAEECWIDLRAHGKMFGQISHDGRRLRFKRREMEVVFDVQKALRQATTAQTDVLKPIENCSQL